MELKTDEMGNLNILEIVSDSEDEEESVEEN